MSCLQVVVLSPFLERKKKLASKIAFSNGVESPNMHASTVYVLGYRVSKLLGFLMYTPFRNERDNLFHYFSVMKSSKNKFYFFTCILPDYVAHESPKEF